MTPVTLTRFSIPLDLQPQIRADRILSGLGLHPLEAACARALDAGSARYRTVKTILAKNLDQGPAPDAATPLPATYTQGGRFCRAPQTALH